MGSKAGSKADSETGSETDNETDRQIGYQAAWEADKTHECRQTIYLETGSEVQKLSVKMSTSSNFPPSIIINYQGNVQREIEENRYTDNGIRIYGLNRFPGILRLSSDVTGLKPDCVLHLV